MKTFARNDRTGRYEALPGKHDDRVMALGIGILCGDRYGSPVEATKPEPERRKKLKRAAQTTKKKGVWDLDFTSSEVFGGSAKGMWGNLF
jgi:hypothetical protein